MPPTPAAAPAAKSGRDAYVAAMAARTPPPSVAEDLADVSTPAPEPIADPQADPPMNYGAIGAVIGHEMTHGYDDQGSRFAADGNFENWWSEADAKGFAARTDKLVQQFDAYEALPGLHVNGKLTLGENIADLGW